MKLKEDNPVHNKHNPLYVEINTKHPELPENIKLNGKHIVIKDLTHMLYENQ